MDLDRPRDRKKYDHYNSNLCMSRVRSVLSEVVALKIIQYPIYLRN